MQLKEELGKVKHVPLMSEGAISPTQINRMGNRERKKWQSDAQRRMALESEIRWLEQPQSIRDAEQKRADEKARNGRIAQLNNRLQMFECLYASKIKSPRDNRVKAEYLQIKKDLERLTHA